MRNLFDETALKQFAHGLAAILMPGDVIALNGDLGAGKTTFARFLISALLCRDEEVPSPTFSIVQTYDAPRMTISHFDLYRLSDPGELEELGFLDACSSGLVLVEWPERAGDQLPHSHLELTLHDTEDALLRDVALRGRGGWTSRLARFEARRRFLDQTGWGRAQISHLNGDASTRAYARLAGGPTHAILMDAPPMPDGPPVRGGLPYSRVAHLAEDVRPFVAVATALRAAGLSAPEIHGADLAQGFLILEDLGNSVFDAELARGRSQSLLWRAGVDLLLALRALPVPASLSLPGGGTHALPVYDGGALQIEVELLLDWYWPAVHGGLAPGDVRDDFLALWQPLFDRLQTHAPHWILRDFHSPNLLLLPERSAPANVGIIDFQDAMRGPAAYDLVSLLQDARVGVPAALEAALMEHYKSCVCASEPGFERDAFDFSYKALGAQRNTKILGIFARLARRDGKPGYLRHMPRLWGYLERNLEHPELTDLKCWYDTHFPPAARKHQPAPI